MTQRLRIPGEWEPHEACWLAFPHLAHEWPDLVAAQRTIAELCRLVSDPGGELVRLLVRDETLERDARNLIGRAPNVEYVPARYGDVWLRDTVPTLGQHAPGRLGGLCFEFNGWGGKYEMPGDDTVGDWLLTRLGGHAYRCPVVLEGGAIESNGQGTLLTTESCVLNPNRNPGLTREGFEAALRALIVLETVVWLEAGLAHDHTDGHVDMIARFADPRTVLCMIPESGAPNAEVLQDIRRRLLDTGLAVLDLPAPRAVQAADGSPLPATYCNFYVANEAVVVPTYGAPEDAAALETLGTAFAGREVVGLPAVDLLCAGGAFHCATQPQPVSS